jgi:uncharacterized membrane protein
MISPTANKDLMTQARALLTGKWGTVAVATLVYVVVSIVAQVIPILGIVISLIITGPLCLGYNAYMLSFSRGASPDVPILFSGFNSFLKAFLLYLLIFVIVLVGCILLIVPGIIAGIALSMSWFIMIDNPQMGVTDIATASYNMTQGNKWKLFCLFCRFIGWALLCVLTLGIGFLFLLPYAQISLAKFYEEIKTPPAAEPAHVS